MTSTTHVHLSSPEEAKSFRLINSINELPYYRVRPDEAYVVSGTAMREIIEELQKLWAARESLAGLLAKKDSPTG